MREEEIIKELKKNNKKVFSELVELYKNRIFSMAFKYTNDYIEAQDLAQEIFVKIYKEIGSFKYNSKLSTWIYKISTNTCIDWKRKHSKTKITSLNSMEEYKEDYYINKFNGRNEILEDRIINIERNKEIHKLIYNMSEIYKTVIIMYHFNEMNYDEISQALNISKKTVETRLYRARKILKDKLKSLKVEVIENGM